VSYHFASNYFGPNYYFSTYFFAGGVVVLVGPRTLSVLGVGT